MSMRKLHRIYVTSELRTNMTKDNPDILCPECKDFDRAMNRRDGVSLDILVVCNHDWKPPVSAEIFITQEETLEEEV